MGLKQLLYNGFLLMIPVLLWNALFYRNLPEAYQSTVFWSDIPAVIAYPENVFRILVFILPILMITVVDGAFNKFGACVYVVGLLIYFSTWVFVIYYPDSSWSMSGIGFMAPAYSSLFWLLGIALLVKDNYFNVPYYRNVYILVVLLFVFFHTWHSYIVYHRI